MSRRTYFINLGEGDRAKLLEMTRKGSLKARQFKRAMILLKADEGLSDPQIMAALNVSRPCVERIRKRFVVDGLERALNEVYKASSASIIKSSLCKDHVDDA